MTEAQADRRFVKLLPWLILGLAIFIAYQITQSRPPATHGKARIPSPLLVEVEPIVTRSFQVQLDSFGVLEANTQTELFPLVSGQVLRTSDDFVSGAFVQQGQVLLEIDPIEYEVNLQVAKSDLANAELALAEEQARYEQAQRDWQSQKGSQVASDYALRLPQLKSAKASLETAQARLKLAEVNLERCKVRAPYDGRIVDIYVNRGSVITTASRLANLYSEESLELSLPIASRDLSFIDLPSANSRAAQDLPVVTLENTLSSPPEIWQARVQRTKALVDAQNQQLYAVAKIEAAEHLKPLKVGQYLPAKITGKVLDEVILVPNASVYQGAYVYLVEDRDGQSYIKRQPVNVQWRNAELSLIDSGLHAGQRLVTTLLGQVTSGTRVKVKESTALEVEPAPAGEMP